MPANNVEGFRPDVLALLREVNAPVYRWPGGNFVSGYDWRDGIGDPDRRPPRKNPAWKGVEHNDVGIHEFMALWRLIGTEPYIAVNSGLGGVQGLALQITDAAFPPTAMLRRISGTDPMAFNEPGKPPAVTIQEISNAPVGDRITLPPMSVSLFELRVR